MMLLLDRLITLLLLLLKPPVKTSFSLLRLLGFLIPVLIRRFVMGIMRLALVTLQQGIKLSLVVQLTRHSVAI
ncbi:hypothetical protein O998_00740 [Anaplasma phagocytophilum str. Norway variant1]|uniref:Uncharacterized protein n=1 Tax=Anaplasma phagocytophilum str. Norway variant1 TaxID=1392506 RepID=A0A7H9DXW9_ANAPH|nr:hypothetical protein O998_00740 [Anaplasma phagocytophilum str. Norway variant1]